MSDLTFHTNVYDSAKAIVAKNISLHLGNDDHRDIQRKENISHGNCKATDEKANSLPEMHGFTYEMTTGFVAVINNTHFPKRADAWRHGSDKDLAALRQFFKFTLNFEFREYVDHTAEQMINLAKDLSEKDLTKWDSFFFIVLSHGRKEGILGVDEKIVPIDAITGLFTLEKCPSLTNKPKIFLIQACRGDKEDLGAVAADAGVFQPSSQVLPIESDFLVAYSSPPGYTSFRNLEDGSWFVQTLAKVFDDYFQTDHLMDMLTRVNFVIAKLFSVENMKQMPMQECSLTKKCFFCKQ